MYLVDHEIQALLDQIRFETSDPKLPFVPTDQVQPCSVDLRLDAVFWRAHPRKAIDLRRTKLLEVSPRRHWKKVSLNEGESILLRPGEMLLGRTFEEFSIPPTCAGKLEGRSSFGRMGISIHCTADFINPGYRGHMPLEIINHGKSTVRLFPLLPICQLIFIRLNSEPRVTYGARDLSSKYMNDDGGPSYWWRDKRVRELQKSLGEHDVVARMQVEILERLGPCEPEIIERFERLVEKSLPHQLTNARDLLDRFALSEERASFWSNLGRGLLISLAPALIVCSVGSIFGAIPGTTKYGLFHFVLWGLTVVSIPSSIIGLRMDAGEFMTRKNLAKVAGSRGT